MITKMRKYAFMVYHKEYDTFLSTLRDLGVVHVKETKSIADNADLQALLAERKRVKAVMQSLQRINEIDKVKELAPAHAFTKAEARKMLDTVEEWQENKQQLLSVQQSLEKDIDYMSLWGEFSWANFNRLKQAGWDITFFTCPTSKFEPKWRDEYNAVLINYVQSVTYFVTITPVGTVIEIDAERPKMPDRGLAKLHLRQTLVQKEIAHVDEQLKTYAAQEYQTLDAFDRQLQNVFNMANVKEQTDRQAEDRLMCLEGWTTDDNGDQMEQLLDAAGYYFHREEIEEGDQVPIKLKNNAYSRLFEPITRMFSLPNYTELDPTPLFAPFFMLFFALCFGDGGYGLLILLGATLLKKKVSPDYRPFLSLFQWLGGMTIVVACCTGSFFGVEVGKLELFAPVKDYFLNSDNLMTLSIVIGIVHIIFGKIVAAYKTKLQKGTKHSIAPFAWVFVITAVVLVFGLPTLNIHLSPLAVNIFYGIAAAGLLVAFLYNMPGKNVFINFGNGLWTLYNVLSGLLGDTLSYIRLFAIGLTGGILGGVFNSLAFDMTEGLPPVVRFIPMLIILLVGHSLNFGLCMISSMVHPLRLVFVEYYKNAEFEGGGREYLPFKKA